jgi:hypothetical protein
VTPAEAKRLVAKAKREKFENLFALQVLQAGALPPVMQYPFAAAIGRKWRADFAWPEFMLLCEIQGGAYSGGRHVRGKGYEDDCERKSTAVAMGWAFVEATPRHVREGKALRWVEDALLSRGWKATEAT